MLGVEEVVRQIQRVQQASPTSSFFVNGPPGSGKSWLLAQVADRLAQGRPRPLSLGPFAVQQDQTTDLSARIIEECQAYGFLACGMVCPKLDNLCDTWDWLAVHGHFSQQRFLLLLDVQGDGYGGRIKSLGNLFSDLRALEGTWRQSQLHVFSVVTATWSEGELQAHCNHYNISFPYTPAHNQIGWLGIPCEAFETLAITLRPDLTRIQGRVLHELCGGHPAIAQELLSQVPQGEATVRRLLACIRQWAGTEEAVARYFPVLRLLSKPSRALLRKLLEKRYLPAYVWAETKEVLVAAGVVEECERGGGRYLRIRSHVVEALLRSHAPALGLGEQASRALTEMMPEIASLSGEAFGLIGDIENTVRNFAVLQLASLAEPGQPLLAGRSSRYSERTGQIEDAHTRAAQWQQRSLSQGLPADLNPLIAYLSMRDLAELLSEIGRELRSHPWQQIGSSLRGLAEVRDAVMHGQLVDESALQRLVKLQAEIYQVIGAG